MPDEREGDDDGRSEDRHADGAADVGVRGDRRVQRRGPQQDRRVEHRGVDSGDPVVVDHVLLDRVGDRGEPHHRPTRQDGEQHEGDVGHRPLEGPADERLGSARTDPDDVDEPSAEARLP